MDLPGPEVLNREILSGVSLGEALLGFAVIVVVVAIINRIQRARMVK